MIAHNVDLKKLRIDPVLEWSVFPKKKTGFPFEKKENWRLEESKRRPGKIARNPWKCSFQVKRRAFVFLYYYENSERARQLLFNRQTQHLRLSFSVNWRHCFDTSLPSHLDDYNLANNKLFRSWITFFIQRKLAAAGNGQWKKDQN